MKILKNNFRKLIIIVGIFLLAACSTPPPPPQPAPEPIKVELYTVVIKQGITTTKDLLKFSQDLVALENKGARPTLTPEKWSIDIRDKSLLQLTVRYEGKDGIGYGYKIGRGGQFENVTIYFNRKNNTVEALMPYFPVDY